MKIASPAFINNGFIPKKYTSDGEDINPPLVFEDVPPKARSLALIVDDPDAPAGTWVHWVVFDMDIVSEIAENSIPGTQGTNDSREVNYGGPYPPSGTTHRYFFKLYALDVTLGLKEGIRKNDLEEKMKGHICAQAQLIGLYKR